MIHSSHPTIIPWCENWARVHSDSLDWMGFFSSNLRVPRTHRNMAMLWCHPQTITVIRWVPARRKSGWAKRCKQTIQWKQFQTPTLLKWSFFRKRRYKKVGVFSFTQEFPCENINRQPTQELLMVYIIIINQPTIDWWLIWIDQGFIG